MTLDDQKVRLVLMDTTGEEKFGRLRNTYFEGSLGCIAVYDITRQETFTDLPQWIADFHKVAGRNTSITIIGNKIDLEKSRTVTIKDGRRFARTNGFQFYECSARLGGTLIPKLFIELIRKSIARI
jgi:small GTP-binding protein